MARRRNIETVNFESSAQRRGCYVLSRNSPFGALDTGALWEADAPHGLSAERRQRVFEWADARGGRDRFSEKGRGRHLLEAPELKLIAKEIGLDPNRPIRRIITLLSPSTSDLHLRAELDIIALALDREGLVVVPEIKYM